MVTGTVDPKVSRWPQFGDYNCWTIFLLNLQVTWSFFSPGDLILSTHSTLALRGLLQGHGFPGHDISYRGKLLLLDKSSASLLVQQWTPTLCRNWRRMEGWWLIGWAFISWRWVSHTEHLVLSTFIYFRAVLRNTGPGDKTLHRKKEKNDLKKNLKQSTDSKIIRF